MTNSDLKIPSLKEEVAKEKIEEKKEEKVEEKSVEEKTTLPEKKENSPKSILDPEENKISQNVSQGNSVDKNETEKTEKKGTSPLIIVAITASLVIFISIGVILIVNFNSSSQETLAENPETTEELVTPTPTPSLVRSTITFEVLNASSTSGLAKKGAEKIEALGYKVGKTGNYSGEITKNELYLSSNLIKDKEVILEDLKEFKISSVSGELKDVSNSARLILFQ